MTAETTTRPDAPPEHVDVLIIGAGLSGIAAAHYLQRECPWATYAILESRAAIGGTWDLFRYPGIRSDSDMYTFSYSFRPWDQDRAIGDGESIRNYIVDTATEAGIDRKIRYHHRIETLEWSTDDARWVAAAHRSDTDADVTLTCDFVISCTGYYRYDHGYEPEFAGRDRFGGTVIHPQHWPEDFDATGKRIVVIGSGATAVTLVPELAKTAAHVTMLQRSPTYMASLPTRNPVTNGLRRVLPNSISGSVVRWMAALFTQGSYVLSRTQPALMKRILRKGVERELPKGYDVDRHFTPHYEPWDQRLCVVTDGDLFRAIGKGTVSVETDTIDTFTETGIRLSSGTELDADVVVTATGLELLFIGGIDVVVDGEKIDPADHLTYKGMMMEGVPNMAFVVGYTNASWTLKAELTCDNVCKLLNHKRSLGMRQLMPVGTGAERSDEPLFGLTSGYIARSAHLLPRQGTRFPWKVHQSYLRDYRALKMRSITDDVMQFSNPAPTGGSVRAKAEVPA